MRVLTITPQLPSATRAGSMAPAARQIESLQALGTQMNVLEIIGLPMLKYLQALPSEWSQLAAVDVIHAHFGYCGWLARSQWRKPVVVSFMGDDLLGTPDATGRLKPFSQWMVAANRRLARMVDAVIVKSAEMAEVVAPVKAYVIPNGVDLQTFQPMDKTKTRMTLGWDPNKRYILFPGNPANPRKGFTLAQAATQRAAAQLGETLELVSLWQVAPDQVPLYMNGCDVMLMASLIEGSPNVVKEAMACNLPVVSVPVGDVAEILRDVPGYVICPRDAEPLADALVNMLITMPRAKGRLALEAKGLDVKTVAQKIMRIYDTVLSCRTKPGSLPV